MSKHLEEAKEYLEESTTYNEHNFHLADLAVKQAQASALIAIAEKLPDMSEVNLGAFDSLIWNAIIDIRNNINEAVDSIRRR